MKRLLIIGLIFTFLISCNQNKETHDKVLDSKKGTKINNSQVFYNKIKSGENSDYDKPKEWIKNIFKCKNSNKICFYLDKEKEVCTKEFFEYMIDSEELYGATNLTDEEFPIALEKYKTKWSKIYKLRNENTGAPWLFGRGQDDMENIQEVIITKISELKYSVDVDFGGSIRTKNIITLVRENGNYKIDYCETKFIE